MKYENYGRELKTFVVFHTTGCGEQGGEGIRECEIIGSYSTEVEAMEEGLKTFPRDPSGWTYHNFTVNVNTYTEQGERLRAAAEKRFDKMWKEVEKKRKEHPERYFNIVLPGGQMVTVEHNEALDGPIENYKPYKPTDNE